MRWSFRLIRIAGTEVKVHVTFLLLLAWFALSAAQQGGTQAAVSSVVFLLALFACVLAHEFGHIMMARRFGVRTPDILLLPIGGVARLERIPEDPKQELLVALAGPAVTLALAALLFLLLRLTHQPLLPEDGNALTLPFFTQLMLVNVILLVFNLIPAFPMDGGRVLRAILSSRMGLRRATRVAGRIGQGLAVGFGLLAVYGHFNLLLLLIALFVFVGAAAEMSAVETRFAGAGVTVTDMMMTRFQTLPVHARLRDAARLLLEGDQSEFPVVDNLGAVEGILTRDLLVRGLAHYGEDGTVAEVMASPVPAVGPDTPFPQAVAHLRASGVPALPVVQDGRLVGLLTLENVSELLMVRRATGKEESAKG
jgi:stage IV sporulation protein FB